MWNTPAIDVISLMISKESIDDFFSRYALTMNNALFGGAYDLTLIQESFAEFVVGANPVGIAGSKNDERFAEAMRKGIEFYRQIGVTSMNIVSTEITTLDDLHAVVKVHWRSFYAKGDLSGEIPFEVVYMVQARDYNIRIFAYVTGDEQKTLRDHQLIPEIQVHEGFR